MVGLIIVGVFWCCINAVYLAFMTADKSYRGDRLVDPYIEKYGSLRKGLLRELPLGFLLPLPYIIVCTRAITHVREQKKRTQERELKNANSLCKCSNCGKMIRSYQLDVLEAKERYSRRRLECRYCDEGKLVRCIHAQLGDSVLEFLKNHPECPEIDVKGYEKNLALIKAYDQKADSEKENKRIQEILDSYQETGNVFLNKLMEKEEK